ncbi:hypothetical protein [Nonomuraea sediminis]|uniref:hypothetical protein n=1 Tax=Nonomuraea sediminis TaxID=2835864 RepID=UPI001BDC102F|nr:hypothetical protein [Nonomuraea sediminis]
MSVTTQAHHSEERRLRLALALTHHDYDELLRACRAAVAAAALGHGDPLFWIRDELSAHGQLPPPGIRPEHLAAGSTGSVPAQGGQRDRGQAVDGRLGTQVTGGVEGVHAVGGQLLRRDVA